MNAYPDVERLAGTIGDPTRVRMLLLLMEGRALTGKELAYGTGIEPATATTHLQRLERDGLVESTSHGRCKFFRLSGPDVGRLMETLMVVAPKKDQLQSEKKDPIRFARFCYDHLAGEIGTRITEALLEKELILRADETFIVTAAGEKWFEEFGIDLEALKKERRHFARPCLDWSERRDHLAGALGAALANRMMTLGWFIKEPGSRVVHMTEKGLLAVEAV